MTDREYEAEVMELEADLGESPESDPFLGSIIGGLGSALGGLLGEEEGEAEGLDESFESFEFEAENEGADGEVADALMEVLVDQLAEAEAEQAEQFLPIFAALAPLAVKAVSALGAIAARAAGKVVPKLARGLLSFGRKAIRSRTGRGIVRAVPTIAKGAARELLRATAAGRPVTGPMVSQALARQASQLLRNPRRRRACMMRSRRIARQVRPRLATQVR